MKWPGTWRQVQELVEQNYESLYRYAFRLSGSAADADDLTQETFCRAQMQLHQLRDADRAKAWLFAILRNCFLLRNRSQRTERTVELSAAGELPAREETDDREISPERLQEALDELPEPFRTPVILFYFEEFSYREIAEQMNLPIGTVMSRLARGKAHLRRRLTAESLSRSSRHEL